MSATFAATYNSLPSLGEAAGAFVKRDEFFAKVTPLLATHGNQFGVCLVHRHCTLDEGEVMVATGNICQPERDVHCYPERWLANGQPFEFNRQLCPSPPRSLFEAFQKIVDEIGLAVLGLFFVQEEQRLGKVYLEWTDGRKNVVDIIPESSEHNISTAWLPWLPNPVTHVCTQCIPRGDTHTHRLNVTQRRVDH